MLKPSWKQKTAGPVGKTKLPKQEDPWVTNSKDVAGVKSFLENQVAPKSRATKPQSCS